MNCRKRNSTELSRPGGNLCEVYLNLRKIWAKPCIKGFLRDQLLTNSIKASCDSNNKGPEENCTILESVNIALTLFSLHNIPRLPSCRKLFQTAHAVTMKGPGEVSKSRRKKMRNDAPTTTKLPTRRNEASNREISSQKKNICYGIIWFTPLWKWLWGRSSCAKGASTFNEFSKKIPLSRELAKNFLIVF